MTALSSAWIDSDASYRGMVRKEVKKRRRIKVEIDLQQSFHDSGFLSLTTSER